MDRLLGDFASRKPPSVHFSPRAWEPAIDVYETEDELVILAELAGVREDDIELVVDKNTLIIQGQRREERASSKKSYHQMEISRGPFARGILLPIKVDFSKTRASYEDGILEVVLSKVKEERTHKIKIKTE